MRRALGLLLLLSGCGITPRDGQFTCPDGVCPAGQTCIAGVCTVGGIDAEVADVPGLDAPGRDVAGEDVPGRDAPMQDVPPGGEACAPGPDRVPRDEDLDGRIDETCPLHFGRIHPVLAAMRVTTPTVAYFGGELTADGLSLFTVPSDDTARPFEIATRPDVRSPFQRAVVASGASVTGFTPQILTVSADGREVYMQMVDVGHTGPTAIFRTELDSTWTTPALSVALVVAGRESAHPHLSRDGFEIYFTARVGSATSLYYSERANIREEGWDTPELIGPGSFPTLSPDGLTLFFLGDGTREVRYVTRSSTDEGFVTSAASASPFRPTSPGGIAVRPFLSPLTREVFFSLQPSGATPPEDGPTPASIFRAEVCRDAPCGSPPPCPVGEAPSFDGLHCYRVATGAASYAVARSTCTAVPGAHVVTIHSLTEASLVRDLSSNAWLGQVGGVWDGPAAEPFLYREAISFGPADCGVVGPGSFAIASCTDLHAVVCETDTWPTYTD